MLALLAVTGPVYLLMALGWAATRGGLFSKADLRVIGKYVLTLALPALLFNALSSRPLGEVFDPVFLLAYAGGSLLALGTGVLWARRVAGKPLAASAYVGMGMSCSNTGFIGFPLAAQVFGASTAGVAVGLVLLVENFVMLPLVLALADTAAGEGAGARGGQLRRAILQSLRALLRTPMIHGLVLGAAFSLFGWRLPSPLAGAVDLLAMSCAPLSLVVIGGSLVGLRVRGMARDVACIAAGKLLLHPLAVMLWLVLLPGVDAQLRTAAVLLAAVPMLGIYPLLAHRHGQEAMAAAAQLGTTVASFFTLTSLVWILA